MTRALFLLALCWSGGALLAQLPYSVVDEGVQPYVSIALPANKLVSVSVCDECIQEVSLPFPFPWFGERIVQNVTVTSNGQVNMDARFDPECCGAAPIPDEFDANHDAIFLVKSDLNPALPGGVYATTTGAPPNRLWILEYRQIPFWLSNGRADAQLILSEADGSITMHFGPAGDLGTDPITMLPHRFSAGVEARGGQIGNPAVAGGFFDPQGICATAWPAGRRVRFVPSAAVDLVLTALRPSASVLATGGNLDVEVDITKFGAGAPAGVRVDLFINPPTPPTLGQLSSTFALVSFAPELGATATAQFTGLTSAVPGAWELYAIVDSPGAVAETDTINNSAGPARIFWSSVHGLPFTDGFDAGWQFAIDPPNPAGGAAGPCEGTVPCEHARAVLDPTRQSGCRAGSTVLVLDCDTSFDWLGLAAPAVADDPDRWELPSPQGMPSHTGRALVRLDTAGWASLELAFDYAFLVGFETDQQFVVEVDDGRGWRRAGALYRPVCAMMGGCGGAPSPWTCERLDLSSVVTGGEVQLAFRWLTRGGVSSLVPTAVLLDSIEVVGDPTGLRCSREAPPASREISPPATETLALPFRVAAVGEQHALLGVTLSATGDLDDATELAEVRLYEDIDGSRTLTAGDVLLATGVFATDDGTLALVLSAPAVVAQGTVRRFVVTARPTALARAGALLTVSLTDVLAEDSMGLPADLGGLPVEGDTLRIAPQRLTLAPGSSGPPEPVVRVPGQSNVVVAQWRVSAEGAPGQLRAITLRALGDGDDATGLASLRLVQELPGSINGRVDAGEPVVASSAFPSDDGMATFALSPPFDLVHGSEVNLLYVVDVTLAAASGGVARTFGAYVDGPGALSTDAAVVDLPAAGLGAMLRVTDGCAVSMCGDCDVDGDVDIIDALYAAQHASGILTLTGNPFANCNVTGAVYPDPSAAVTVLDALMIAQRAAGLPAILACC